MKLHTRNRSPWETGLDRLVFFSDAVFAIAITLLALEIRLPNPGPAGDESSLLHGLIEMWPKYLGYAISFLVIGGFWIGHHRKFRYIIRYDNRLMVINLFFLMTVAFVPFPTSVISEYGNRVATIFYAIVIAVAGLLSGTLFWYASFKRRLIDPAIDERSRKREMWIPLLIPAVFLGSIGISFIDPDIAKISWALVAVVTMIVR